MSDWWNKPFRSEEPQAPTAASPLTCPWCAEPTPADVVSCPSCGAVMAQRDDLGGLVITGVTAVDPALNAGSYSSSIIRSQSQMSALGMLGHAPGGTVLQVAAATTILARDGLSSAGNCENPEDVGKPSQAALDMAERLRQPPTADPPARAEFSPSEPDQTDSSR